MGIAITVFTLAAVLIFSLSCALLLEEMIFGGLFRLFFFRRPQPVRIRTGEQAKQHEDMLRRMS